MMNQFGLIIQETTAGSGQQFVSAHLDVNNPEIKETITDERFIATQLANLSDVYSVQITKNYKVYSLIVTDLADFLGRSGYYAIRLYGPKGVNLTNFEIILDNLKKEYNKYTNSNNLNNQNYDAILSSILIIENERKNFISQKSDVNCYYYFEETNTALSTVFNNKGINLVHKVYAFNKGTAVGENSAESLGLKPYTLINSSQKEINIINSHSILKELKINNQSMDFNPNVSDFNLICQSSDVVVFNTTDDKNFRQINNSFITIERKFISRPPEQRHYPKGGKKTFWDENGIYLGILLLTIMIAGGSYYYFEIDNISGNNQPYYDPNSQDNQDLDPNKSITKSEIKFEVLIEIKDSIYKTKYKNLDKYKFRFKNKKWQYKNTEKSPIENKGYTDFFKETLDDIIKVNPSSNFDENKKDEFIRKLEEESGHKIVNKEILEDDINRPSIPSSQGTNISAAGSQKSTSASNSKAKKNISKQETEEEKEKRLLKEAAN